MKTNDGGPAFPWEYTAQTGMSLRDWFAGQAVASLIAKVTIEDLKLHGHEKIHAMCAAGAYITADAMIAERDKLSALEQSNAPTEPGAPSAADADTGRD